MSAAQQFTYNYNGQKYTGPFDYQAARAEMKRIREEEKRGTELVFVGVDFFIRRCD